MARNKKYDDDDGRVIADMSAVERQPLVIPKFGRKADIMPLSDPEEQSGTGGEWDNNEMSKSERRAYITGALGATLAIASVFVVAAAIFIFVFLKIYA